MTSRPVPPGRHPNWCSCQGCRRDIAEFESAQWKRTLISGAVVGVIAGIVMLAKVMAHAWHAWAATAGVPVAVVLAYIVLRVTREPALVPAAHGAAEIADEPAKPPTPACHHPNAVRVEGIADPDLTLAWLCPACDAQLDEDFGKTGRYCCGVPHGGPHEYNCPHAAGWAP